MLVKVTQYKTQLRAVRASLRGVQDDLRVILAWIAQLEAQVVGHFAEAQA